jgi:hypothetical protein
MRIQAYTFEDKVNTKEEGLRCPFTYNPPCMENEIRIEVYKGARIFGLVLVGGVDNQQAPGDCGIYVSKVLEGGLADVDKRILPGDRITAIKQYLDDGDAYTFSFDDNGTAKTHEDVKQILRRCKGKVELFIVRKDEKPLTTSETLNSISQNVSIEPTYKAEAVYKIPRNNTSFDQSEDTHESDDTNSESSIEDRSSDRAYERNIISRQRHTLPASFSKDTSSPTEYSRIKLINLTPLKHSRSWPLSQNSKGCSLDYRDMAKYGIRPNSSLSTDIIQPLNSKVKDHRIKKNWASNKMSTLSIQEDEEEELYATSLPQVQKRFEIEREQRVL